MTNKKIVYIAHPIGGDVEGNLAKLREVVRGINKHYSNIIPFVPYYSDVVSMDDSNWVDRERGISNGLQVLTSGVVDELWAIGKDMTEGMKKEVEAALSVGIPCYEVRYGVPENPEELNKVKVDHPTGLYSPSLFHDIVELIKKHGIDKELGVDSEILRASIYYQLQQDKMFLLRLKEKEGING